MAVPGAGGRAGEKAAGLPSPELCEKSAAGSGAAGTAAESVPWDALFTERFGAGAADSPAAEGVFQNVDVTSVCGDVTLTVRQALGDEKTLYLLLDYQLPESVDMEMVQTAWEERNGPLSNVRLYSGTVD